MVVNAEHENARSVVSIPMRVGANGKILGVLQGVQNLLHILDMDRIDRTPR